MALKLQLASGLLGLGEPSLLASTLESPFQDDGDGAQGLVSPVNLQVLLMLFQMPQFHWLSDKISLSREQEVWMQVVLRAGGPGLSAGALRGSDSLTSRCEVVCFHHMLMVTVTPDITSSHTAFQSGKN